MVTLPFARDGRGPEADPEFIDRDGAVTVAEPDDVPTQCRTRPVALLSLAVVDVRVDGARLEVVGVTPDLAVPRGDGPDDAPLDAPLARRVASPVSDEAR